MLYVYALVRGAPRTRGLRGLSGEPLRVVRAPGCLAVVSDVAGRPEPTLANLRGHDRVVTAIVGRVAAVLPTRFATVVEDDDALAEVLGSRRAALEASLSLVEGREQMTLRLYGPSAPVQVAVTAPQEELGPGARYLTGRMAARRAETVAPEIAALRPGLTPLVRGERVERSAIPPLVATVYHLIDRGAAHADVAAVDAARDRLGDVQTRVSGPWAPYAFAPQEPL